MIELEETFMNLNLRILELAKVQPGEQIVKTQMENLLHYMGNNMGQKGVQFLINPNYINKVIEVKGVTDRIALIKLKINNNIDEN